MTDTTSRLHPSDYDAEAQKLVAQMTLAENKSKHMAADALVDCQPVACHVKHEQKIVWFTG